MTAHPYTIDTKLPYDLVSRGSGRPVTITYEGVSWTDADGVEYFDQNDGSFIDENGDVFDVVW